MAAKIHYPVAIVGGGPTGLTLANLLGVYGVECLVLERNAATVHEPRAVSIDDESLRTMQASGIVDEVMSQTGAALPRCSQPNSRSVSRAAMHSVSRFWSVSCARRWHVFRM